jgi:hypothetical protein
MAKKSEGWLRKKMYADGETWLYCYYTSRPGDNKRVENSKRVGLVLQFPTEIKAWIQVGKLGYSRLLDNQPGMNPTFSEIAEHWRRNDLKKVGAIGKRAAETISVHESNLDGYVLPKWGNIRALSIQPVDIETWFEVLASEPQSKNCAAGEQPPKGRKPKPLKWGTIQKIKSAMSLVYCHALRHSLIPVEDPSNPFRDAQKLGGVRCKVDTDYDATVVLAEQMIVILDYLDTPATQMEWMLALLHAATGLRPEEGFAIKWRDIDWERGEIKILRAWSKGKLTEGKNPGSMVPVAMHPVLAAFLLEWREQTLYAGDEDWVFPSLKLKGAKPRSASTAGKDYLRLAAVHAGVIEQGSTKRFGWHNLRHSLATFLAGEVDPTVIVKTLRNKRETMMKYYIHRVNAKQQAAQGIFLTAIGNGKGRRKEGD